MEKETCLRWLGKEMENSYKRDDDNDDIESRGF